MSQEKRPITAEDLYNAQQVSTPQVSPDGSHVIFAVQRVDRKTEKKYTNLWLVASDGSAPARQFTYGDHVDRAPQWSPDGRHIAFLSNRRDENQFQLYLIPTFGGEARPLTSLTGSFASFAWSPDGNRFVAQFRQKDEEAIERDKDEQKKKLGVVARHITSVSYKADGVGYLPQEKWHIWTINAETGEATQLTAGEYHETEPCWSPDGSQILFVSNRSQRPDFELDKTELYLIPANGGEMTQVAGHAGRKMMPSFSPNGRYIAYLGRVLPANWWQNASLYIVPVDGSSPARNITHDFDIHLSSVTNADLGGSPGFSTPVWSSDSNKLFFTITQTGDQPLLAVDISGDAATLETIISGKGVIGDFSLDNDQQTIAYFWGDAATPSQIRSYDLASQTVRSLTNFNEDWLDEIAFGDIEEVWIDGPDNTRLHGWILKPVGFDPSQKYPSIMEIHGGPQTQYGHTFMHEFHYLAASGCVVYWSNPRGSQGYGNDHSGAIYNAWGTVDYADVMAWADYMEQQPYIDPDRMGVTGGSYGGYMTTLIIGRSSRFKAAVAQRLVSNFISFYGSSDMNWAVQNLFGSEADPWNDLDNYWKQSPISYIGGATTPTLIIHSESDNRCDREQGEQVFVALQKLGVPSEMLLVPGESHGLSRIGRTDRRIARLSHMRRWFETYL